MGIPLSNETKNYLIFNVYNKGRLALKLQLHVSGTRMIFPSIVAGGFVAFIATQLRMSFSSSALQ